MSRKETPRDRVSVVLTAKRGCRTCNGAGLHPSKILTGDQSVLVLCGCVKPDLGP